MNKKKYNNPKITINKVYTKTGDAGYTSLIGGDKVSKDSLRISVFGEIDELNCHVGNCIMLIDGMSQFKILSSELIIIQHELFNLGNMIATKPNYYSENMPQIDVESVKSLEKMIDLYNDDLPMLKSFVLPGGSNVNIGFHLARTICRRCERLAVKLNSSDNINTIIISYLNRLSDLLFVLSRWCNYILDNEEMIWNPNYRK